MLHDLNAVSESNRQFKADVCVCGTGPAGITLATTLAASGKSVVLMEAGNLEETDQSQQLYEGENLGLQYWGVENCRQRYFGGTSNRWSGMCGIFDPVDFEPRKVSELPGWPIALQEVLRFLPAAGGILDLGNQNFSTPENSRWSSEKFALRGVAYSPPTRFGEKYRDEILKNQKIQLLVNANAIDLELDEAGNHAVAIVASNYGDVPSRVTANQFVLALGALENARFLLNCSRQISEGIGNHSGMVGRCFMEHLDVGIARFISTNDKFWFSDGSPQRIQLVPRPAIVKRNVIGNGVLSFQPSGKTRSSGRTRALKQALREALCRFDTTTDLARAFVDFDCEGDGLVTTLIEQFPNPDSRVTLSDKRDRFGLRKLQLRWVISDQDRNTVRRLAVEVAKEMARLDLARLQLKSFIVDESSEIEISGHCHQMGTTRMSTNPVDGVVDSNCRVHGMNNLYIAGSSVFPTGGGTNPTFTIVMLSLRLAEHLAIKN